MFSNIIGFPANEGFYDVVGQIISIFCMKSIIMGIDVFVDKADTLHPIEYFVISTTQPFCRALYTRGHKTYFYFFIRKLIPRFHRCILISEMYNHYSYCKINAYFLNYQIIAFFLPFGDRMYDFLMAGV